MADPQAAVATQLRNIQTKTGKSLAQLYRLIADSGLAKVGEQRSLLMQSLGLGYGDANAVALAAKAGTVIGDGAVASAGQPAASAAPAADPLEGIYAGKKAALRPLHERLSAAIDALGPHDKAVKKTYISLRRKKQFAMLGPATASALELGLNVKALPPSPRLKAMPAGGMCQYTVRIDAPEQIDAALLAWIKAAFDAAA